MSLNTKSQNGQELVLVSVVYPTETSQKQAILLADSIRTFGGDLARVPLWWYVPRYTPGEGQPAPELDAETQKRLRALGVEIIPFEVELAVARFFFAADLAAAALAEERATGQATQLAWLTANTLVLQEPQAFVLDEEIAVGYRPVHHINVGSPFREPLDPFWSTVYRTCDVPRERVFAMETHVDRAVIRPYVNAGHLVVRPEQGLLRAWHDTFFDVYRAAEFDAFYRQDQRYFIFVHQAILSGVLLASLSRQAMQELPATYNYPLHLYAEDVTADRPTALDELVTCRYEDWGDLERLPLAAGEGYRTWLEQRLG
ncbi:MAG: hypothetical protein P8129_03080 [Anaerolineae bacterium]